MVREGYKQTEVGVIPEDWEVVTLGDICQLIGDGTHQTPTYVEQGVRFVSVENVTSMNFSNTKYISEEAFEKTASYSKTQRGDILLTRIGTLGKTAIVDWDVPTAIYVSLGLLRLKTPELAFWTHSYSKSEQFVRSIESRSLLKAIPQKINLGEIAKVQIPLPPTLPEQRAIATALSDTDALLAALDALIGKKEAFKRGMMEGVLSGELRLAGFSGEWEDTTIGEIASIDERNLGADTKPDYEFKYLSLENVNKGTVEGFTKMKYAQSPSRARRIIEAGCIVFATVRPLLMSHALIKSVEEDLIASTGFAVIRAGESADSKYLFYIMTSTIIMNQVELLLVGSNYPAINSKDVKNLELSLPSLPEQRAIATVLSDLDEELSALRARRAKLGLVKAGMMEVLLSGGVRLV